jgi:RNA polymerase sigma-70 factor (ECF subfamily)
MTSPAEPSRPEPLDLSVASDRELVERAREGVDDAYRELVRRYRERVLASVLRIVPHRERAEDLAQEAFVRAFAALDRYCSEHRLAPWLLTIASNAANDYVRRGRPDSALSELALTPTQLDRDAVPAGPHDPTDTPTDPPTERPHADQRALALQQALNDLRWDYRQCVILHYLEHRSHGEIARIMRLPVGTVKSHLSRARKQLRRTGATGATGGPAPRGGTGDL